MLLSGRERVSDWFHTLYLPECQGTPYSNWAWYLNWPVWLHGWVFVYELSGCGFDSCCSRLKFSSYLLDTFPCQIWYLLLTLVLRYWENFRQGSFHFSNFWFESLLTKTKTSEPLIILVKQTKQISIQR